MRSSRIGFITTSFPRSPDDPSGAFVHGMAAALARRGHMVEVVVPEPAGHHLWDGRDGMTKGVSVFPAPYARPARLQRLFYGAGVLDNLSNDSWLAALVPLAIGGIALRALRRARAWDALVSHWLVPSALIGGLVRGRAPHLAIAHSGDVHLLTRSRLGPASAHAISRAADRIGFVSGGLRAEFSRLLGAAARREKDRLAVVPMGIDHAALAPAALGVARPAIGGRDLFTVLFLGRLVPIKGVDVLIEAAAGVEGMRVIIAGDGPLRGDLEALAARLRVNASFEGAVGPARRARLLAECDAIVVPSRPLENGRHEGLPTVILEAMAAGLPVVAADTGGIGEVVRHGETGYLFAPDRSEQLRGTLRRLATSAAMRSGVVAQAKRLVKARAWDTVAPVIEALLDAARLEIPCRRGAMVLRNRARALDGGRTCPIDVKSAARER